MKTPVEVLLAVAGVGGRLGVAGDKLRTHLPSDCSEKMKDAIRRHKFDLLKLLRLNFLVVRSDTVNALLFWVADDATKEALISAGADQGSIYTASELEQVVNRRVTFAELSLIHAAKKRFSGKVTEP